MSFVPVTTIRDPSCPNNLTQLTKSEYAEYSQKFEDFKNDNDKNYDDDKLTEDQRKEQFILNLICEELTNADFCGVSRMLDFSAAEFAKMNRLKDGVLNEDIIRNRTARLSDTFATKTNFNININNYTNFDWISSNNRLGRAVIQSAVQYQRKCGSCWAFAAAAMKEAFTCIYSNVCLGVSALHIAACSLAKTNPSDDGCSGGDPFLALEHLSFNFNYRDFLSNYHGTTMDGQNSQSLLVDGVEQLISDKLICLDDPKEIVVSRALSTVFTWPYEYGYNSKDEFTYNSRIGSLVLEWLNTYGPAMVLVNANRWQNFRCNKIVTDPKFCDSGVSSCVNHAVLLVGWGIDEETDLPYWLLRNSYSSQWGDEGYVRILQDSQDICGIAKSAIFMAGRDVLRSNRNDLKKDGKGWKIEKGNGKKPIDWKANP